MADVCCSPDSSTQTQQQISKKKRKIDSKCVSKEKQARKEFAIEKEEPSDVQNHAINSTQDIEKEHGTDDYVGKKKSKLRARFKTKLKQLNLKCYDPILELNEIESDFKSWSNEHLIFDVKSLSELVDNKKQLGKEVFHLINKKEFKKLLPKSLKKHNVRDVRSWCLNEMENTSSAKLLAILKGNDYQSLELTTQGTKPVEISNHLFSEGLDGDETLTINDGDIKNIDNHNKANVHEQSRIDDDAEMKSDHELFEEIIKTPDQNEIDELLNDKSPSKTERKPKTDDKSKISEKETEKEKKQKLAILEMELRARALKSFIKAQEKKNENDD